MTSYSQIPPVSVGAGVARTSLGTNNKPSESQNLIEFTPWYAESGAFTASQSVFLAAEISSVSVKDILPKRVITPPIMAGLGATFATLTPILQAYECNTPLESGSNDIIEAFGQAQVANTVAPIMGVELHYSNSPPVKPQMYYEKPDNETAMGTAATSVSGNTITINGGTMLQVLMAEFAAATPTASQHYVGSFQFNSSNFENSQDLDIAIQPKSVGLSTLTSSLNPKASIRFNVGMGMKPTTTINTVAVIADALTGGGNFIGGVGYNK